MSAAPPVSTEHTLSSPTAPALRNEFPAESLDRTAARASIYSQSTVIYTPRVTARRSRSLDYDKGETASFSSQSSTEHPSSWHTCAEELSRHSSVRVPEEVSVPPPDSPSSLPYKPVSKQSTRLSLDSLQHSVTKPPSANSVVWPDTDTSSIARRVIRGFPELRLLKPSKSYDKPSRRSNISGKETPKTMDIESTAKNVHEPVRAKQRESTDSDMPRHHRSRAPKKPTSLATMRTRVTDDMPGDNSRSRSQPRPPVTAVLNAQDPDPSDKHALQTTPESPVESRPRDRQSSSSDSHRSTVLQTKQSQPFLKPLHDERPSQWRSISHDFFYRKKPPHRREASDPQLRRQSGAESAPTSPLAVEITTSNQQGNKKKKSLRRWMSKRGLFSPASSSPPLPSASSEPGPTPDSPPMLAARPITTKTMQGLQPYVATEARRVTTPPFQTRGGKLHGFYFDFKPPEAPDEPPQGRLGPSFPMPKPERDEPPPKSAPVSTPVERDWFRVRMDAIMAEGEDDDDAEGVEWDVPEHLPGSPLCPLSPKHKSGGKGICVYHGRRRTQHAAEILMA